MSPLDDVPAAPSALAVINTLLSIVIAGTMISDTTKKRLIAASAAVSALAILLTFVGQHRVIVDRDAAQQRQTDIRETLGSMIEQEHALMAGLADAAGPRPDVEGWDHAVTTYLETTLGHSYVVRYGDSSGLVTGRMTGVPAERQATAIALEHRAERLEEFSRQSTF